MNPVFLLSAVYVLSLLYLWCVLCMRFTPEQILVKKGEYIRALDAAQSAVRLSESLLGMYPCLYVFLCCFVSQFDDNMF